MKIKKVVTGIHTLELTLRSRNYADNQNIVDALKELGNCQFHYQNAAHTKQSIKGPRTKEHPGIATKVRLAHDYKGYAKLIVTPASELQGKDCPLGLFSSRHDDAEELLAHLWKYLSQLDILEDKRDFTVTRLDLTTDIYFPADTDLALMIKILRKSLGSNRYCQVYFDDSEANRHSCEFALSASIKKKQSPQVVFKAYDKIYELQKSNRCPKEDQKKKILRLELTLCREALLKRLKIDRKASQEDILHEAVKHQKKIMKKVWHLLSPCSSDYVRYNQATKEIQNSKYTDTIKAKMLFLLRKTSDSNDLATAIGKLTKEYSLSEKEIKKVLQHFDDLGIHPVTIPQNESLKDIFNFSKLIDLDDDLK